MDEKYTFEKKSIVKEKEEEILTSQIRKNNLERVYKKLENKKIKKWRIKIFEVIFYIIYDIVILFILISYIIFSSNIINYLTSIKKTIAIISLYVGTASISLLGAYTFSKIKKTIKDKIKTKEEKIKQLIIETKNKIYKEEQLQEKIKKEITNILNNLDVEEKTNTTYYKFNLNENRTYNVYEKKEQENKIHNIKTRKRY